MSDRPPPGPAPAGDRWPPALVTAAGRFLPGATPLDPGDHLGDLAGEAATHQLTGPALAALALDQVALPVDRVEALRAAHLGAMRWCVHLEARLVEVRRWFDEAGGVEMRVLKGPAVAHLDEPDPTLRSFADLDLLIAPHHLDRAVAALHRHGSVRRIPERRPGFDARFAKGVGTAGADGVEIDVHRTLVGRAHGFRIPLEDLFADPDPFEVGGHRFLALSRPHRALHAAYHAVAGSTAPPLRTVRDLGGYLTAPGLGPEVLAPIAERWRGTAVLAEAAALTLATFGPEPGADDDPRWSRWRTWVDRVEIDPAETVLLARGRRPVPWPVEWTTLRELGWADRARFCWAVAVPADEGLSPAMIRRRARSTRSLLRSRPWTRPAR